MKKELFSGVIFLPMVLIPVPMAFWMRLKRCKLLLIKSTDMAKLKPPVHEGDHGTGNKNANIILVEFGDYQCPHCGHAYPLLKRLIREMSDTLYFIFRHFPLSETHPAAIMAAQAAEAAARQNKFWEM